MKIITHENGPFLVNTYFVLNETSNKAIIIDPGNDLDPIIDYIQKENIDLDAVVCTHAHIDHIAGVTQLQSKFQVSLYLNEKENEFASTVSIQAQMFGVPDPGIPRIDENLPLSGQIELAGMKLELLHTPGHSPGSVSLFINDVVFCGDTLFNMSIGRTDLPGGDYGEIIMSIKNKLFTLPEETKVLPGHGPGTTIGVEKEMNPFF